VREDDAVTIQRLYKNKTTTYMDWHTLLPYDVAWLIKYDGIYQPLTDDMLLVMEEAYLSGKDSWNYWTYGTVTVTGRDMEATTIIKRKNMVTMEYTTADGTYSLVRTNMRGVIDTLVLDSVPVEMRQMMRLYTCIPSGDAEELLRTGNAPRSLRNTYDALHEQLRLLSASYGWLTADDCAELLDGRPEVVLYLE
jgi:hypothetical protein